MTFNNADLMDDEIAAIEKEKEEEQERYIQDQYDKGIILDSNKKNHFVNGNSKLNNKKQLEQFQHQPIIPIPTEKEIHKIEISNEIKKLRKDNYDLTFEHWSNTLIDKRQELDDKVNESFPGSPLELDFILSIKTILNINEITLPFMGIVFAAPSSMKTQVIELLRKWIYSYFTDKFTAKSFVSHSATVAKEKLKEVDLLPRIKDKVLLTPELSPLFTGKEEDIKEQFGIITRLLDGNGLETESGVHGQRGYYGKYMFTWIGAAVDIPHYVYKFLSTIGFKIYFLRLPRTEVTTSDLIGQITANKSFSEKIREIEKLLIDYLKWFEICPLTIGLQNVAKIEWDKSKDDGNTIKNIAELAILLAHLRGNVAIYKSSDRDDLLVISNNSIDNNKNTNNTNTTNNTSPNYSEGFIHGLPTIENASRANQQLYNLARGHALSHGINYITEEDIPLIIKVVLSTASIERVLILDLLIANKGTLTTSQITTSMRIANNTAKRTMTEFKGLELVTMERSDKEKSNSEYKITLNPKFSWFLTDEFKKLRECCDENTPCVPTSFNQEIKKSSNSNNDSDSHRGENRHSKKEDEEDEKTIKAFRMSVKGPIHYQKEDEREEV